MFVCVQLRNNMLVLRGENNSLRGNYEKLEDQLLEEKNNAGRLEIGLKQMEVQK